jgi:fimbrial chaperone protein
VRALLPLAIALGASLLPAATTICWAQSASQFELSPTRLELGARGSSALLELTNKSAAPMRVQVSGLAWDQSPSGQQLLTPTGELVVFPTLFELAPGEARKVKVGILVEPRLRERTYRLVLRELPPPVSRRKPQAVTVITQLSVPIFQQPLRATTSGPPGEIAQIGRRGHHIVFDVHNRGTTSVMLKSAKAICRDARGRVVWQGEAAGWYLLAGGKRSFELEIPVESPARTVPADQVWQAVPAALVEQITSVEVEAETDQGTWRQRALVERA